MTSQVWALPGPLGTETSANELVVVLNPNLNSQDVLQGLAQAGFPTLEVIPGLPPRYSHYRKLQAPNTAATRAALLGVNGVLAVRPVFRAPDQKYPILTNGRVIAKFKPGTPLAEVNAIAAQNNCRVLRQIEGLSQVFVFASNQADTDPAALAQALAASGQTVFAHPSLMFKLEKYQSAATTIDDPLFVFQSRGAWPALTSMFSRHGKPHSARAPLSP
jgi:hypothetical protein